MSRDGEPSLDVEACKLQAPWSDAEITALLNIWVEQGIQNMLNGAVRNKRVFKIISSRLSQAEIIKTPEQCQTKIKRLKLEWRKVQEHNQTPGNSRKNWKHFHLMSSGMANRQTQDQQNVLLNTSELPNASSLEIVTSDCLATQEVETIDMHANVHSPTPSTASSYAPFASSITSNPNLKRKGRPPANAYMEKFMKHQAKLFREMNEAEDRRAQEDRDAAQCLFQQQQEQHERMAMLDRQHEENLLRIMIAETTNVIATIMNRSSADAS